MRGPIKLATRLAVAFFVVLVFLSAGSIAITAVNYRKAISAVNNVILELDRLELRTDGDPEIQITIRLANRSPLAIRLKDLHFGVYLNGDFLGSNYDSFAERTLNSSEETDLEFVIPLRPFYQGLIERAQQEEQFEWSLRGRASLQLPFGPHEYALQIREGWSGTGE